MTEPKIEWGLAITNPRSNHTYVKPADSETQALYWEMSAPTHGYLTYTIVSRPVSAWKDASGTVYPDGGENAS
jgi:hypothetical protein